MEYFHGTIKEPKETDPSYDSSEAENFQIMTWLINSMNQAIKKPCLYYSTGKQIWDSVTRSY